MRRATPPPDRDPFFKIDTALARAGELTAADESSPEPRRSRAVLLSLGFTAAVLLLAGVVAYVSSAVAFDRAADHTDARVAVLESDLQQRRSAAAQQNASRDAQLAELRRLVCVFADRAQPRDAEVEQVRARYGCSGPPTAPAPPAGSPTVGQRAVPGAVTDSGRQPRLARGAVVGGGLVFADWPVLLKSCL